MKIENSYIDGLVICKPNIIHDERGFFCETFRKDLLEDHINMELNFCQSNSSESIFGTIRGLHFQAPPFEAYFFVFDHIFHCHCHLTIH